MWRVSASHIGARRVSDISSLWPGSIDLSESRRRRIADNQMIINLEALHKFTHISIPQPYSFPSPPLPYPSITHQKKLFQLLVTHPKQISHPLIQSRRKNTIHITEQAVSLTNAQFLPQEIQHHAEARGGADLKDLLLEDRGAADGVEAD